MRNLAVPQDWSAVYAAQKELTREMTLPDERYRAVQAAKSLLIELCDPKRTPRVPRAVRLRAAHALRHYPSDYDMSKAAQTSPDIFAERLEDLHRFVLAGALDNSEKS